MDITQILLVVVISVLTLLLVVIGIQVVKILQEIRKMLGKMNTMMDHAAAVSGQISKTVTGAAGLMEGIKTGLSVVNYFKPKNTEKE